MEEHNYEEPVNETYQKLRILPKQINYPKTGKGEEFFEQLNLPHLYQRLLQAKEIRWQYKVFLSKYKFEIH